MCRRSPSCASSPRIFGTESRSGNKTLSATSLAKVYRQQVEQLHGALRDPATREEAFELIRSLIDEIRLVPEEGELRVELKGELAGILALAADSKKPGDLSATGLAEQIKMVAGTRNCLDLLLQATLR